MAEPIPINIPAINPGGLPAAMAGAQAAVFTATDRKVIEELTGTEINKTDAFLTAMGKKQSITDRIEDEQAEVNTNIEVTAKPALDVKGIENRIKDHNRGLKYSAQNIAHDHVEITEITPEEKLAAEEPPATAPTEPEKAVVNQPHAEMIAKTAALAKELNLDPSELFDKFALEQSQLYTLVAKIKELHLKRLLAGSRADFEALSAEIKRETLASVREEAREWLNHQLDGLTRDAAEYKLNLVKTLQSMHYDDRHDGSVQWLQQIIDKLNG